MKLRCPGQKVL